MSSHAKVEITGASTFRADWENEKISWLASICEDAETLGRDVAQLRRDHSAWDPGEKIEVIVIMRTR
jgi:hypothetical protein